jgi:serine/threonine protein kinase
LGQLASIFEVLGTPSKETWPSVEELPDYGKLNFAPKHRKPLETIVPRAKEHPPFLKLLEQLLVLDPNQRISADAVLQQGCFQKISASLDHRKAMQDELIPENLLEPVLLSNPMNDLSLASREALQLATSKRRFLQSMRPWIDTSKSPVDPLLLLPKRCRELCANITIAD